MCMSGSRSLKNGWTKVKQEEEVGRSSTATIDVKIQKAREMILTNQRVTIDEVACSLQISHGSAYETVHDKLRFYKVSAGWVPRELTEAHNCNRVDICQHLFDHYNDEGEAAFDRTVTGDEIWVHLFGPESKMQSMEWKHQESSAKKDSRRKPSAEKVLPNVFWDTKGPIMEHYVGKEYYSH
ncbi:uncharacterized protein LOC106875665 [Octopus bimaculoides]|uniref:uncharacterized protein LOC106875665 n=1 Tax=Octopus bimaculoides TaxID=37653 RepID=UPI00071E4565|nr:uncharacterized protein LOC106875665 [Octopus bimaculoides]|eukprot:XP_014779394.1 PREDICTED: uncharacterized protein LOC106875665 [Octopus bimaculoides]